MEYPRLYLAFARETTPPKNLWHTLVRCLVGDMTHMEIAMQLQEDVIRYTVFAWRINDRVFRTVSGYDERKNHKWVFLRVPCTKEQLAAINNTFKDMIAQKEKFSWWKMARSASPFPAFGAKGTFCAEVCARALQAAGMFPTEGHPPEAATTLELYQYAQTCLDAYEDENPSRHRAKVVDELGNVLSQRYEFNDIFP